MKAWRAALVGVVALWALAVVLYVAGVMPQERATPLQASVAIGFFETKTGLQQQGGSGTVIRENATHYYILTAKHVALSVPDSGHWEAQTSDGYTLGMLELFAVDGKNDLALFRINKNNTYAPVGVGYVCNHEPRVLDEVYAIGQALGREITVTRGIIGHARALSALWEEGFQNTPPVDDAAVKKIPHYMHDALILPGSSGGGLFDTRAGCLLGVNTSIATIPGFYSSQVIGNKAYAVLRADIVDFLRRAFP